MIYNIIKIKSKFPNIKTLKKNIRAKKIYILHNQHYIKKIKNYTK